MKHKSLHRMDARRFEWSALFAVALLLVALSPSFAASALAMSPTFSAPVTAISSAHTESCSVVLKWFQAAQTQKARNRSAFAVQTGAQRLDLPQHQLELPQFAASFQEPPALKQPVFSLIREHEPHIFAASLNHHEAGFLAGVRNNRSID